LTSVFLAACQAPAGPGSDGGAPPGYPAGPYGTQPGTTIAPLVLSAKNVDCDPAVEFYDQIALAPVSLDDYRRRGDLSYLLLTTVAGWCDACNHEQSQIEPLITKYRARGLRVLEILTQGYDSVSGAAATDTDVNHWATVHSLTVGLGLDPSGRILDYVDASVSPAMNIVVRLPDMQIVHMTAGEETLDPVIASFLP